MKIKLPEGIRAAKTVTAEAGSVLFRQGEVCSTYYIVLDGAVRVFARSPRGKEVVLYRVSPGDICILTTSCILSGSLYPADAVIESKVTAMALPKQDFEQMMKDSEEFREFVLMSFGQRLTGLITLIEQVALESVAFRLAQYLLKNSDADGFVASTHESIATEIGSAREVVGRHLKGFSTAGIVETVRGQIRVIDALALESLD
ncbi:Crp/Fnr family transcriptional regulator [Pseudohalioglobus lutimaris]|nr:Crp/Fnr family transcriptional regulator [Pseudohalioglobus lutimaris]